MLKNSVLVALLSLTLLKTVMPSTQEDVAAPTSPNHFSIITSALNPQDINLSLPPTTTIVIEIDPIPDPALAPDLIQDPHDVLLKTVTTMTTIINPLPL